MGKRTQQEFIDLCYKTHGNKYDYSLSEYVNNATKVRIICKEHGLFEQKPLKHINEKQGCKLCGKISMANKQKRTKEEFINEANKIHNNKYDYSLVDYNSDKTPIKIICSIHGIFEQTPNGHLSKKGCKYCGGTQKLNTESFIKKAIKIYGDKYDYSLVDYIDNRTKIKIICKEHGIFESTPNNHLRNRNCPKCRGYYKTTEDLIKEFVEIHKNKYDYSLVEYVDSSIKVSIVCPKHGIFNQIPNSHLSGKGCPKCSESKGERKIREYLEKNNIKYIPQHKFNNCRTKRPLPFDFYLTDYNIAIEYNGRQHYEPVSRFGGTDEFVNIQIRDNIKTQYCLDNKIKLIRIRYDENIIEKLFLILQSIS